MAYDFSILARLKKSYAIFTPFIRIDKISKKVKMAYDFLTIARLQKSYVIFTYFTRIDKISKRCKDGI